MKDFSENGIYLNGVEIKDYEELFYTISMIRQELCEIKCARNFLEKRLLLSMDGKENEKEGKPVS